MATEGYDTKYKQKRTSPSPTRPGISAAGQVKFKTLGLGGEKPKDDPEAKSAYARHAKEQNKNIKTWKIVVSIDWGPVAAKKVSEEVVPTEPVRPDRKGEAGPWAREATARRLRHSIVNFPDHPCLRAGILQRRGY